MPSIAAYLLPLALLAIFHCAAPAKEGSGPLRGNALQQLLRKRSLEAALQPPAAFFEEMEPLGKRGEQWIWMPAHGYMPVPTNEVEEDNTNKDTISNLLRYG
ncbi:uncharacterized protein LOC131928468 [Physella acuta]|uniref:uncharacterized protein LOC131928468 n=1 Tax=Physella acuta TaxID=109671 RepID=UPI0027DB39B5|nr:uncharacterized protein LOC131928468 [Physella acuta]